MIAYKISKKGVYAHHSFLDDENREHYGLESQDKTAEILQGDLYEGLSPSGATASIAKLLAPVDPVNVYCIGLNYREHAAESGMEEPKLPIVFAKPTSALCHPGDPIRLPACQQDEEVDYECELAAVIGKPVRDVAVEDALDCAGLHVPTTYQPENGSSTPVEVNGYAARGLIHSARSTRLGNPDEVADPQDLGIKTILNGQTMQDHTTGDMIFLLLKS